MYSGAVSGMLMGPMMGESSPWPLHCVMTRYFTTAEAAEYLRVSIDLIRDAIKDGRLVAKRTSNSPRAPYIITEAALDEWYESWPDA